jgi:hypothetical protein
MKRLEKSKELFEKKMKCFKDKIVQVGNQNETLETIYTNSISVIGEKIINPLDSHIITLENINKDLDKVNVVQRNQIFRNIFFIIGIVILVILFLVLGIFILQTILK